MERAVGELLRARRPLEAYATARPLLRELPSLTVACLLDAVATADDRAGKNPRIKSYGIEKAFVAIDGSDDVPMDVVVKLEWAFFAFLKDSERQPRELSRALAEDPTMFVTLLRWAFLLITQLAQPRARNRCHRKRPGVPQKSWTVGIGSRAWSMAKSTPPALSSGSSGLASKSRKADRLEICDRMIGHMLALSSIRQNGASSIGEDGAWPAEPLRHIIERIASEALDYSFQMGVYASREVVWRGRGGGQERELAAELSSLGGLYSRSLAPDRSDPA